MPPLRLLLLLLLPCMASALPKGSSVIPAAGTFALEVSNDKLGKGTRTASSHAAFKEGLALETSGDAQNPWDTQAATKTSAPVASGDVLLASFWIRALKSRMESGEAQTQFVFELGRDPWEKSAEYPVRAGKEWRQIFVPFQAKRSFAPGEAQVILRMGYAPQAFEVGGLEVQNFGTRVKLSELPVTKVSYPGREPDAPWRKAAQERILKHRTGPLQVKVLDSKGAPIAGAELSVVQTRSAYNFGSAVSGHYLFGRGAGGDGRYEREIKRLFNTMTEENAWKWPALAGDWGGDFNRGLALQSAMFASENGLFFRGHVLFWPSWRNSPKSLKGLEGDKAALRAEILDHVKGTAEAAKPLVGQWDVINEPFDNHDLTDILGDKLLDEAFRTARLADPKAKLYINDYAILSGGGGDSAHRRHYEAVIQKLLRSGAPLQGIGMQGHFGWNLTAMDDVYTLLNRYAALGPKISITEYDIEMDDLDLAGDYTRDFLTMIYSHPSTEGFVMWGFWDGAHWGKNAPLYKMDWTPKPALKAWEDLVLKEWRTSAQGLSDAQGLFAPRAHLGEYEIKVKWNGKEKTVKARLAKPEGVTVNVQF